MDKRQERKELKQKLFKIRRFIEGEKGVKLDSELKELKIKYEENPAFTNWEDFPEKWDIGDPNGVKAGYIADFNPSLNDVDRHNYLLIQNKTYDDIVFLIRE
jgi:hypothetical protein